MHSIRQQERLVKMLKAVGHPMRFQILRYLIKNPSCYTKDIVRDLPISQATVSQHIQQLRDAGCLSTEAHCQMTKHWINKTNMKWFETAMKSSLFVDSFDF